MSRQGFILLIAIAMGLMSAFATRSFMTRDSQELLVPINDIPPNSVLKDPKLFDKKFIAKSQILKANPVTAFDQLQGRQLGQLVLRAGEPIYLDDLIASGVKKDAAKSPRSAYVQLPPGKVALSLSYHELMPKMLSGQIVQIQEPPSDATPRILANRAEVLQIWAQKPDDLPDDSLPQAILFAVKPTEAKAILELLEQGKKPFVIVLK